MITCNDVRPTHQHIIEDDNYDDFRQLVADNFPSDATPVFTTDAVGLWEAYLDAAPPGSRASRDCRACERFIRQYGGLVKFVNGGKVSAVWPDFILCPKAYQDAARVMARLAIRANITGVFYTDQKVLGTPTNLSSKGQTWTHTYLHPFTTQNADAVAAEKRHDHEMLASALTHYRKQTVATAVAMLESGQLFRSEKCIGVAKWLLGLYTKQPNLWLAVARAPTGYCHVRSGMIGTLLDDIQAGYDVADVKRRFDSKMDPRYYQRPQSTPSDGNIEQAEKIIAPYKRSLERRYARLADVRTVWEPRQDRPQPEGVFGHLRARRVQGAVDVTASPTKMTWVKFRDTVLPSAESIEMFLRSGPGPYIAITTAVHEDAPVIFQWGHHVAWYLYQGGSSPEAWGLNSGKFHPVTAVVPLPSSWNGGCAHQGDGVTLVLKGAHDVLSRAGGAIFPETLKGEFHSIRKTIEAYSRSATITGGDRAEVCGYDLRKGAEWNCLVRVTSGGMKTQYLLDRWD